MVNKQTGGKHKNMKKWIALMLIVLLALPGVMPAGAIANPWTEATPDEIMSTLGLSLPVPESAENVVYRMLAEENLAEVQFVWRDAEYIFRIRPSAEYEDISGLNYEWPVQETRPVRYCDGTFLQTTDGERLIEACLWYDAVPGLMYSLAAAAGLDSAPDTVALANVLFEPVQGDADASASAPTALTLADLLLSCTGWEGTAGASLKQAAAAYRLADFAIERSAASAYDALTEALPYALMLLNEEDIAAIESVCTLLDECFVDYESLSGLFSDAGVEQEMSALIESPDALSHCLALTESIRLALADRTPLVSLSGPVLSAIGGEGYLIEDAQQGEVMVLVHENTFIEVSGPVSPGDYIYVDYNGMMTRSLPPQVSAETLRMFKAQGEVTEYLAESHSILMDTEDYGEIIVFLPEDFTGELSSGDQLTAYFSGAMTLSLPPQVSAGHIVTE